MTFVLCTAEKFDGAVKPHPAAYRNRAGEWIVDFWDFEDFLDFIRSVGSAQVSTTTSETSEILSILLDVTQ